MNESDEENWGTKKYRHAYITIIENGARYI